jgi:hypothetical protein
MTIILEQCRWPLALKGWIEYIYSLEWATFVQDLPLHATGDPHSPLSPTAIAPPVKVLSRRSFGPQKLTLSALGR